MGEWANVLIILLLMQIKDWKS